MNKKTTTKKSEIMEQEQATEQIEEAKPYTFRELSTKDIFPMFKLLNKIGIKELKDNESLKNTIFMFMGGTTNGKIDVQKIGIDIFLEIASLITECIPKCENELYTLLASVAEVSVEDIKTQSPAVTFEMIVDFVKKEEFKDFFKVVSKLFK